MSAARDRYIGQFRPEFSRVHHDDDLLWLVPFAAPVILGVTGPRFSGVTTALGYLSERHDFDVHSLGGEVRRLARARGVSLDARFYLQDLGDRFRREADDPRILARTVLRELRRERLEMPDRPLIPSVAIGGIKHIAELSALRRVDAFHLVLLECQDATVRYRRVRDSGILRAEYEGECRRQRKLGRESPPAWDALDDAQRWKYFESLDAIHQDGHPTEVPPPFKAVPGDVINEAERLAADPENRVHSVKNETTSIVDFRNSLDEVVRAIRPRGQIVRYLTG